MSLNVIFHFQLLFNFAPTERKTSGERSNLADSSNLGDCASSGVQFSGVPGQIPYNANKERMSYQGVKDVYALQGVKGKDSIGQNRQTGRHSTATSAPIKPYSSSSFSSSSSSSSSSSAASSTRRASGGQLNYYIEFSTVKTHGRQSVCLFACLVDLMSVGQLI